VLKFAADGPEGRGPAGVTAGPLRAQKGSPLELVVYATDDGRASSGIASDGRENVPVTLTWFLHQGPAAVQFSNATPKAEGADGKAVTSVTFSAPGDYILRVRANDVSGVAGGGHAQCCWSNGFVRVNVR
jgi:hypothetical protein